MDSQLVVQLEYNHEYMRLVVSFVDSSLAHYHQLYMNR